MGQLLTSHSKTAQFTSDRFRPRGAARDLSQVCQYLRRYLTPTFDSGYEVHHQRSHQSGIDTHVLTLGSKDFKTTGITKISLRLRLKLNQPDDWDANTGVEPGVATSTATQSPIGDTHVENGTTSNPSTQFQQPATIDPSAAEYDEWLKKLEPLQDFNGNI
jgi:hypothetical protein